MRKLCLLMLLCCAPLTIARAEDSCGPKSGLCWPEIKRGASGPRVTTLQFLLRNKGYKISPDGNFGYSTESAMRKFQVKNRLQVDGKVGWQSWEAITPNLKRGARGDAVRALQTLLNYQGKKVKRDGVFGKTTEKAMWSFPIPVEAHGLDDTVDDVEWCYLSGGGFPGNEGD